VIAGGTTVASGRLPHTGITAEQCFEAGSDVLVSCSSPGALALNDQQDGMRANVNPMSYSEVPRPGGGTYARTECVRDNVTGLIWEGKEASGLRAAYFFSNLGNGQPGDASSYLAAVNSITLCGYSDWRLPTANELQGLFNYSFGTRFPVPNIDTLFFPNSSADWAWSTLPNAGNAYAAWAVNFYNGEVGLYGRDWGSSNGGTVRLVRGGY
jgi:hypothetical protein